MQDSKTDSLAARLRSARHALGMTQTALSGLSGIASAQLSRYESGQNFPSLRTSTDLANCLHVNVEWLRLGVGPRNKPSSPLSGRSLQITTTLLPEGGTEITFRIYEELREIFMERAYKDGIPLDAYLKNALLELAKEPREQPDINELARKVKALIEAGVV